MKGWKLVRALSLTVGVPQALRDLAVYLEPTGVGS